ncbi:MAG: ABC transporter substrate-binding protein, partial [Caldilineaceae bacterium]|nr:ABC transporter substrate-binding protein [Caldilineaceae bacterium]
MQRLDEHNVTRRNFLKGAALAAAGGVLAACAPAAAPATGTAPAADEGADDMPMRKGGTLVFGYPQKTSYQNLLAMEHNAGNRRYYLIGLTHNCLVNITADYTTWLPELAESWEFDGNKAIFHLRKDVKWHDGEPFSSDDVLFTIGRLTGHPNVLRWNGVRNLKDMVVGLEEFSLGEADEVSGVSAPDAHTFVFELKKPFRAAFLERLLSHPIMPK